MIRCNFCRMVASSAAAAARYGWIPGFVDEYTGEEVDAPTCPLCRREILAYDSKSDSFFLTVAE